MNAAAPLLGLAIALPILVAGCTQPGQGGKERPTSFIVGGDGSWMSVGYAYDGADARRVDCIVLIETNDRDNNGQLVFDLLPEEADGRKWDFIFASFAGEGGDHRDGGVATDVVAHGDTGREGPEIPAVRLKSAGWGEMRIIVDGRRLPDPVTGGDTWLARYEVLDGGVRDQDSGAIWNAARSGPYDPARPGDALVVQGDEEIHVRIMAHQPPPQASQPVVVERTDVEGATYSRTHPLVDARYHGSRVNATVTVTNPASLPVSNLSFSVRDPQGLEIASFGTTGGTTYPASFPIGFTVFKTGVHNLVVAGTNFAAGAYEVSGQSTPPPEVVLNFWWEQLSYGQDGIDLYEDKRHDHGH